MQSKLHDQAFSSGEQGVNFARDWLLSMPQEPKFLVEQNRNLGDTLHLTPIIRHYRTLNPNAAIAFVIAGEYANAHQFNPDIDKLITIPKLNPQERIKLRYHMLEFQNQGIEVIAPSIFPYGEVWPELKWCHRNIADQYFHNAKIPDRRPVAGRKLTVVLTDEDRLWAKTFMSNHNLTKKISCAVEFNSYSNQPIWRAREFHEFTARCKSYGIRCISICGQQERPLDNTISCAGITWRQTVALLNEVGSFIGIKSGLTMLAGAAPTPPTMLEICIEDSISISGCGYANSIPIVNTDPVIVADHLWYKVINQ